MSEIQRSDVPDGDARAASGDDRDAKIEQLLLAGLDHYFAAQYEQAINVWTRALFIDRSHARARAYIDRARSALAERQRQSEELLHDGVAAFHRGESDEARRLLRAAIDAGAPSEEALAVLERLNRLERPAGDEEPRSSRRFVAAARRKSSPPGAPTKFGRTAWVLLALGGLTVAAYAVALARPDWDLGLPLLPASESAPAHAGAPIAQDLTLPLPRRGEILLTQGRALAASGHLHEALAVLEQIRATDAQKDEADRLRADVQRQLLALASMPAPPSDRRLP